MKKIGLFIIICLLSITNAIADDATVEKVNTQIANLLLPLQDERTTARFTFTEISADDKHALTLAFNTLYKKKGKHDDIELKVDNLKYNYSHSKAPHTIIRGALKANFTKLFSQEEINHFIPFFEQMFEALASEHGETIYGKALNLNSVITSITKDQQGNYIGITGLITANIRLDQLPEDKEQRDVVFTDAAVSIEATLKDGIAFHAYLVSNPLYKGFEVDQVGLKQKIEKISQSDQETLDEIKEGFINMDDVVSSILNQLDY